MKNNFIKLKKIQIIEEPRSEELLRSEIENALAGWECTCFIIGSDGEEMCSGFYSNKAQCSAAPSGGNFCSFFKY